MTCRCKHCSRNMSLCTEDTWWQLAELYKVCCVTQGNMLAPLHCKHMSHQVEFNKLSINILSMIHFIPCIALKCHQYSWFVVFWLKLWLYFNNTYQIKVEHFSHGAAAINTVFTYPNTLPGYTLIWPLSISFSLNRRSMHGLLLSLFTNWGLRGCATSNSDSPVSAMSENSTLLISSWNHP